MQLKPQSTAPSPTNDHGNTGNCLMKFTKINCLKPQSAVSTKCSCAAPNLWNTLYPRNLPVDMLLESRSWIKNLLLVHVSEKFNPSCIATSVASDASTMITWMVVVAYR
jgi:hypothetical protein